MVDGSPSAAHRLRSATTTGPTIGQPPIAGPVSRLLGCCWHTKVTGPSVPSWTRSHMRLRRSVTRSTSMAYATDGIAVQFDRGDHALTVQVAGELDAASAPRFTREVIEHCTDVT